MHLLKNKMKFSLSIFNSLLHSSFFCIHLSFVFYSLIYMFAPSADRMISIIRIMICLISLAISRTKKFPRKTLSKFLFILILLLTYFFQGNIDVPETILLSILQINYSLRIRSQRLIFFIQAFFLITLYQLENNVKFVFLSLLAHVVVFFTIIGFIKFIESNYRKKLTENNLRVKETLTEFPENIQILLKKENTSFLNIISDALILFDPNTKKIDCFNSNASLLLSSVDPTKIDDLPPWPLYPDISSISDPIVSTNVLLSKLLDSDEYQSFSYFTKIDTTVYSFSVYNISNSISIIIITPKKNVNKSNNTRMLSYVTHELRTPLNCINTMLDALMRSAPENLKESYIIPAKDSLGCLLAIVNDLLDMSQMMAGKFSLSLCEFKLNHVTKNVIRLMTMQAELKGIKIIYEESKDIPYEINSDPGRLRQVLINLMSNAMKYTNRGWIKLNLSYIRSNLFEVSVSDTGLGIKEEDLAKLFLDFGRIKNAEDQSLNNYGIGLGLAISDALVKELGGGGQGLQIESEWGKGTTFKFQLRDFNETDCRLKEGDRLPSIPMLEIKKTEQSMSQSKTSRTQTFQKKSITFDLFTNPDLGSDEESSGKNCECKEILICDDSPFNILALKFQLKSLGKDCDAASYGEAALLNVKEKLNNECCKYYKFIFMDLEMPTMDGYETAKKIKEILYMFAGNTKIVAFSGYDSIEERTKALQAGMEGFLVKPVMEKELNKLIQFGKERHVKSEEIY